MLVALLWAGSSFIYLFGGNLAFLVIYCASGILGGLTPPVPSVSIYRISASINHCVVLVWQHDHIRVVRVFEDLDIRPKNLSCHQASDGLTQNRPDP